MMEEKNLPLVSIVVPCYNHEKYVKETIESIINQTYKNIELIVIDDGSKDNSVKVIQELADKYNFIFIHRSNKGVSETLNEGIKLSKGEYISFIASDDIFSENKLEILLNELKDLENTCMVFGDAEFIDENSKPLYKDLESRKTNSFIEFYTDNNRLIKKNYEIGSYETLIYSNYIPAMSVLCKRESLFRVGLFDTNLKIEDYPMWLKLSKLGKIVYVNKVVAKYRIHGLNSIITNRKPFILEQIKILNQEFSNIIFKRISIFYFLRYIKLILNYLKG